MSQYVEMEYYIGTKVVNKKGTVATVGGYTQEIYKVITEDGKHERWTAKDIVKSWNREVPNVGDYIGITNPLNADKTKRTDGLYEKGEIYKVVGISTNDRRAVIQIGDEVYPLLDEEYDVIEVNK